MTKLKVTMILKNAQKVQFECDTFATSPDPKTGELASWKAEGVVRTSGDGLPVFINPSEVAAITVLDYNEYDNPVPQKPTEEGEE